MAAQDVVRPSVAAPLSYKLRVRYGECDQQGVVFNAHYFAYFDIALTEAWRELFGPYLEMYERGIDMVVAEARARFLGGARFDDELELRWWVTRLGTTAMSTRIDVVRDGTSLVEGEMRHVFVEAGTTNKKPIPPEIRAPLERHLVEPGPDGDAPSSR
jgi:acyl-CoA thioester hydrolase